MISTHLSFVLHCHTVLRDETVGKSLSICQSKPGVPYLALNPNPSPRPYSHRYRTAAWRDFFSIVVAIPLILVIHPDLCQRGLGCVAHNHFETPVVTAEDRFATVIHIHLLRWARTA